MMAVQTFICRSSKLKNLLQLDYADIKAKLNSSETNNLEFKPNFSKDDAVEAKIFDTIIAMANTTGGNIVVGVSEEKPRKIVGTVYNEIELENRISQWIQEYVDPPNLNVEIYSIESSTDPKLIGIEVHGEEGRYFGKRYFGRYSRKPNSYTLLRRSNGSTVVENFQTFISIVLSTGLARLMQDQIGRAWIGPGSAPRTRLKVNYEFDRLVLYCRNYGKLPAVILWVKSLINTSKLTVSDIRSTPERYPKNTIFPDAQDKFSTDKLNIPYFSPESPEEIIIWFGFIVRYIAHSKEEGEYGILGTFHRTRITSWSEQTHEWI